MTDALAALQTLAQFGTGLSQRARLITLASAQARNLPQSLMAERFTGREAVNDLFAFELDALSVSTDLPLDDFIGEELTIALLQPDGSRRAWHGLCTAASWLGADGGVARYRLRLEPALALLRLRRDSYIFQDRTVQEIVTELLADYPQVRYTFDVSQIMARRAICTQYRESDLEFFTRLLAAEGLNYRFEHDQDSGDDSGDGQSRHSLVIFDSQAAAPAIAAVRYHGVRATEADDAIDRFGARRQLRANAVSISSWDPAQLLAPAAEQQSSLDTGDLPQLALYDGSGEFHAPSADAADAHSALMLQALERDNKLFDGAGAVRRLAAGHAFSLTQHERYGDGANRFTVLSVDHEARNNFTPSIAVAAGSGVENGTYRNTFVCVRDTVPLVPRATAARWRSTAPGPQTALIVGLPESVATTGRGHHVRVQFPWQRGARANPGGLAHNLDAAGNAPGDHTSGTWVRVAEALAGPNWGSQFVPRVGTEVLIDFIEGDVDRPIVVAQLYTGADTPPFAAGVDAGVNHAGTLSGLHSHNFDGAGFNQWQLDDTPGQVRMRLATSSAATQLNLGYLIDQAPATAQRGAYRGSGFELRTDAWAVVRGAQGVLLSTSARTRQGSGVTSTQMDAQDAVDRFKAAQTMDNAMLDAATRQQALVSAPARKAQGELLDQIDPNVDGKHAGPVNGHEASKAAAGKRTLDTAQPVEQFAKPIVMMASAAGLNWATPGSHALFAGQQLHWSSAGDLHLAAAYTISSVAANALSLNTHAGGIKAIAGNGPVSLQAHTGALEIVADKAVTVISVNDSIAINAQQKIVLQAGQSSITLDGGDITFACPGNFTVKGGQHVFDGGARQAANLRPLPGDLATDTNWIALHYLEPETAEGIAAVDYEIHFEGGPVVSGTLDEQGKARHENVEKKPVKKVVYKPRTPDKEKPVSPLEELGNA
jgi:type VI secretion system secreted protein VgrG